MCLTSLTKPPIISMFHMNIPKLKIQQYIKTSGYENISSKADTMEDEGSSISYLKIFLIPLATYPGNRMIKWFSLHKALTVFSFRVTDTDHLLYVTDFPNTKTLHMAGLPTYKHTKDLQAETCAKQHPSNFLYITAHSSHRGYRRKLCWISSDHSQDRKAPIC